MCPDTSAGTLAIAAAPAPHFVCAVQSVLDRNSCHPDLCSPLRQLMWRYRATTYRLIQCSHQYKMVGMLECACAPTHLYARVSVGPTGSAHTGRRNDTPPALQTKTNKQNQASTVQTYAQKGSGGWATNEDTAHAADGRERPAFERAWVSCRFLCSAHAQI